MLAKLTSDSTKDNVKAGYYTTEFWTTVLGTAYMVLNSTGALSQVPPRFATIVGAALVGAYNVSRGIAKN